MKKTEYFLSAVIDYNRAAEALKACIERRDAFIKENKISEIESEKAEIFSTNNAGTLYVLLTLTYYYSK